MKGYTLLVLACLSCVLYTLAEEHSNDLNAESSQESTEKLLLEKSEPYNRRISTDAPSFFTKLKSWLFPFGGDSSKKYVDSIPASGRHHFPIYAPPTAAALAYGPKINGNSDCNPCNKEPWIPVATNYGQNTILGFVQSSELGQSYSTLGVIQPPPSGQYGAPNINANHGPPPQAYFQELSLNYRQPSAQASLHQDLKVPPLELPAGSYGAPPNQNLVEIIPSKPIDLLPPNLSYGPPLDIPAKPIDVLPPPNGNLITNLIPQRPGKSFSRPPRRPNSHGPLNYSPILKEYMIPPPFRAGQPKYLQPPPRFVQKPSGKARPPYRDYGPPFLDADMKPPLVDSFITNYGVVTNQVSTAPSSEYVPPIVLPSGSYGSPLADGDVNHGVLSSQSVREYLPPANSGVQISQSIPLPVFDELLIPPKVAIPFPSLNKLPLTPIHNAKGFHQNNYNADIGGEYQESRHKEVYNLNHVLNGNANNEATKVEIQNSHEVYSSQNAGGSQGHINMPILGLSDSISPSKQAEIVSDIQIVQSIPVANFLSSIEHPINVIQSPLVDVAINTNNADQQVGEQKTHLSPPVKLSENPIVVEANSYDNHPSASAQNITYQSSFKRDNDPQLAIPDFSNEVTEALPPPQVINQILEASDNFGFITSNASVSDPQKFTAPPLDYTSWSPSTGNSITSSMGPPPPGESLWFTGVGNAAEIVTAAPTTKKPKQIQIVIPYTSGGKSNTKLQTLKGKKTTPYDYVGPKLSLYTQPPTLESEWLKYTDVGSTERPVINIKDLLRKEEEKRLLQNLPYDVINLQKNIDGWTEQEYSRKLNRGLTDFIKASTPSLSISSKNIPTSFFPSNPNTTPKYDFYDHEPAGSNNKESKLNEIGDFESNFVITETTTVLPTTTEEYSTTEYSTGKNDEKETTVAPDTWRKQQLSFSDLTKEQIYVVTPQPLKNVATTAAPMVSFSHPPKIGGKSASEVKDEFNEELRLILSEWPHLINNLETTTSPRSTSPHPLFGLMDLSPYIPPPNSTIQTYSGHSKVITIVTPINLISRKISDSSKNEIRLETSTQPTKGS